MSQQHELLCGIRLSMILNTGCALHVALCSPRHLPPHARFERPVLFMQAHMLCCVASCCR
eukprot:15483499-Alexandrium_andersonii.AAC.2